MITSWKAKPALGCKLNQGHPLARNMMACWLFNDPNNLRVQDIGPKRYATTMSEAGPVWNPGKYGNCLKLTAAQYLTGGTNNDFSFERTDQFSLVVIAKTSSGLNSNTLISRIQGTNPYGGWDLDTTASAQLRFQLNYQATTGSLYVRGSTAINDGLWHVIVLSYNGTSIPSGVAMYIDGKSDTVVTLTNTLYATTKVTAYLNIGGWANLGSGGWPGQIAACYVYFNRSLTPADARNLTMNPFQMIGYYEHLSPQPQFAIVNQVSKSLTINKGTQSVAANRVVAINQVLKSLSITSGTQSVSSIRITSVQQVLKPISITSGTQVITPIKVTFTKTINIQDGLTGSNLGSVLFDPGDGGGIRGVDSPFSYAWVYGTYPVSFSKTTYGDLAYNLDVHDSSPVTVYLYQNIYFNACRELHFYDMDADTLKMGCWLEINGAIFPTLASCTVKIFEVDSGSSSPVVSLTSTSPTADHIFEFTVSAPTGLVRDKTYVVKIFIDSGVQTFTTYTALTTDASVNSISDIEKGKWKIISNQMIFYKPDNTTEICRFNLFDKNGSPTSTEPTERVKV